jgi:hypothetical protein
MRYLRLAACTLVSCALVANAQDVSTVNSYKASQAPKLDGKIDPGEWDAAGPGTLVSPDTGFPFGDTEGGFKGASDLSFRFRSLWVEPWMAYFLYEVTDDEAMEEFPRNAWEADQLETFIDGNDLLGNDDPVSFHWWESDEPYGKFGVRRPMDGETTFEGNNARISTNIDDIYADDEFSFLPAAAVSGDAGQGGNYLVELAVSLEPMYLLGTFEGTPTATSAKIVTDSTVIKYAVGVSDDDNWDDGTTERSHYIEYHRTSPSWDVSTGYANLTFVGPYSQSLPGDFDANGSLDAADIDALTGAVLAGSTEAKYDLNSDSAVNGTDRAYWVENLRRTYFGDANLDGQFNSSDFVAVFQAGQYEDAAARNSTWATGDWNGDGDFSSSDFVTAFQAGGYEKGPRQAVSAVPEPASLALGLLASVAILGRRRRN